MESNRIINYMEAIREGIDLCLEKYPSVFIIGPGVPDPKGVFGTTLNLVDKYGPGRVLDMPLSENGITGVCIGAALTGMRPIMVYQRMDFALLAIDELINNAAKWHYMFGGWCEVPLVTRLIIGRGWGQGAQHSQNLQALYAHIPGLKVVMPTTPYDVKGLLISSIEDNNPVIFIEHRWLYNMYEHVPEAMYRVPIGKSKIIRGGEDITIASTSYMTIESIKASRITEKLGISPEIVDIRTIKPLDTNLIIESVKKTGRLLVIDSGWKSGGIAGEVIASVVEEAFDYFKSKPQRIALPDIPTPTSHSLTRHYYPTYVDIVNKIATMKGIGKEKAEFRKILKSEKSDTPSDIPELSFTGPF